MVNGTPLIEIDYLHESRPAARKVPSYPDRQPDSNPYALIVTDPRPSLEQGTGRICGFRGDDPIPTIDIPLAGSEVLSFDVGVPYNRTFESLSYFRNRVDYEREPARFETYDDVDRERVHARMAAVIAAQRTAP